ncbi:MAG: BON domain-containing protein [Pedobacter sp.]|uniref:BON domain-containing protein n=1 Tax=Pedobacter sp. TaxID=1411316 RepID=UPI002807DB33|nr:BON domain-containing protein [Pedobacter sp.]MDQ8003843.1 BON domain-containing protein [Pedobacter sp.]
MNKFLFAMMLSASIAVVSCKPKDADVKAAVEKTISANAALAGVVVDVKDGVATISGELKNEADKVAAETAAKAIKGVKSVTNNITIAPVITSNPVISATDVAISAGLRDLTKDLSTVKYAVKDGVITLTGEISKAKNVAFTQAYMALKPAKVERTGLIVK